MRPRRAVGSDIEKGSAFIKYTPQALGHCFGGIGVLPVGPIALTCNITSPSLAHA